jgi:hypothetical protein
MRGVFDPEPIAFSRGAMRTTAYSEDLSHCIDCFGDCWIAWGNRASGFRSLKLSHGFDTSKPTPRVRSVSNRVTLVSHLS